MRAVIYRRTAVDDKHSAEVQEQVCREWCQERNLDVLAVFSDIGCLGATEKRAGLDAALDFAKRNSLDLVLVNPLIVSPEGFQCGNG